jgi:hypothetical protein
MDAIATLPTMALSAAGARPVPVLVPESPGALSIKPAQVAALVRLRPNEATDEDLRRGVAVPW